MSAVAELLPAMALRPALRGLGGSHATWYRRRAARLPRIVRVRPAPPLALSAPERTVILQTLNAPRFADCTPYTAWARLLDEGVYLSGCGAADLWFARCVQNGTGAQTRAAASRLGARRCCAVERRRVPFLQAARERFLRVRLPAGLLLPAALPAQSPEARASMRQALRAAPAKPVHYERRRPEETTLYRVVQENLETFLA